MNERNDRRLTRRTALQIAGVVGGGLATGLTLPRIRRAAAQQPPMMFPQTVATLTRLAPDVWVWSNTAGYNSLIITSDEGALVTEPSSQFVRGASAALEAIVGVVGPQPVKYVVFSHEHSDHNVGGDVFADTAEFVSHELAKDKIAARNDPRSPVPTITFAEHMTLDLGGKQIELHYFGPNHSDNSIVLHYPERRLIHAVDWMENGRMPFGDNPEHYPLEWIAGLERVDAELDFDILVPGHTPPAPKSNVLAVRDYWVALISAVKEARASGLADNSDEMIAHVREHLAPTYGRWLNFNDHLPLNIRTVIRTGVAD